MTTLTESDVKDLKDLMIALRQDIQKLEIGQAEIRQDIQKLEVEQVEIQRDIKRIEIGQAEIKAKFEEFEKRIDERMGALEKRVYEISTRLNIMTIGFLSIFEMMVTGMLGILGKVVFFPNT